MYEYEFWKRLSVALVAWQLNRNLGLLPKHSFFASHMTIVFVWKFNMCIMFDKRQVHTIDFVSPFQ